MLHPNGGYAYSMDGISIPMISHPIRLMDNFRPKSGSGEVPYNLCVWGCL